MPVILHVSWLNSDEVQGVNSRADLALVEDALQGRLREAAMAMGVTLRAPETIFLSEDTIIEQDVIIEQHVVIARGCTIKTRGACEGILPS